MKITKLVHACLLVETPERTALFDPGAYSTVDVDGLQELDDIIITHGHLDHFNEDVVRELVTKFPEVRITAPDEVVRRLGADDILATSGASDGIVLFESPHAVIRPLYDFDPPQEAGVHYLGKLSHPGDSHDFRESRPVLALPVQAPWGSTVDAVKLGIAIKPKYIVPIHDWHWRDAARESLYADMEKDFAAAGIIFIKAVNGQPFEIEV